MHGFGGFLVRFFSKRGGTYMRARVSASLWFRGCMCMCLCMFMFVCECACVFPYKEFTILLIAS